MIEIPEKYESRNWGLACRACPRKCDIGRLTLDCPYTDAFDSHFSDH